MSWLARQLRGRELLRWAQLCGFAVGGLRRIRVMLEEGCSRTELTAAVDELIRVIEQERPR